MDLVKIGRYIALKRKELGLTQRQLAEKLGVSDKSVSKWERGVCLPDVSLYLELCDALGISVNEFLAGEDIGRDEVEKRSEDNLIQVSADSKRRQKALKRIIAALLAVTLLTVSAGAIWLYRVNGPRNTIAPLDRDSTEMKTALLLSGIDGAFLYRCQTSSSYKSLTIYCSEYRRGELISRESIAAAGYESAGSPSDGMIALVPDFDDFTVKLIVADSSSKISTEIPILEDVEGREWYGRSASQIAEETDVRYDEEQALLALLYGETGLRVLDVSEFEKGYFPPDNDYVYYFSICFSKKSGI